VFVQPQQEEKHEQHRKRFVKLRRMEMHVNRHTCNFMAQLSELNSHGSVVGLPQQQPAAKQPWRPKKVSNRDSGRAGIRRFPPRQFVALHQEVTHQHGANKSAVENAA
jgi:hypothetical protein